MSTVRILQFAPAALILALTLFGILGGPALVCRVWVRWHLRHLPREPVRPVYVRKPRPSSIRPAESRWPMLGLVGGFDGAVRAAIRAEEQRVRRRALGEDRRSQ